MYTKWKDQILNYYVYIHIYLISTIINSLIFLFHVYCPHFFFGQLSQKYPDGYLCFSFFQRGSTKGMVSLLCMSSKYSQPQTDGCERGQNLSTTWDYMGLHGTAWDCMGVSSECRSPAYHGKVLVWEPPPEAKVIKHLL